MEINPIEKNTYRLQLFGIINKRPKADIDIEVILIFIFILKTKFC